jgi:Lysophospholipase L1 and related esterases
MSRILKFSLVIFTFFLLSFSPAPDRKVTIWMIGDSTMALKKKERNPESGWGVEFKLFVNENVIVNNRAASGRSSKSFVVEKRWKAVLDSIQPGDYVIIQFGHNDEKKDSLLHTDAKTTYKQFLKKFIDETRSKAANPIICSSIVRRHFDGNGKLLDTHGDYIRASREIASETNTSFIDIEAFSRQLVSKLGSERSKTLYTMRKGVLDSTHLNHEGARQIAALFVNSVKKQKLSLATFFK